MVLLAGAPASAQNLRTLDGPDAPDSRTDLLQVRITHGTEYVTVRTTFPDLRRRGAAYQALYLDHDPDRRGPEHALSTPLFSGGEYSLVRIRRWRATSGPLDCDYSVDLRWRGDAAVVRVDRGCLGDPGRVRAALVMVDTAREPDPVTDWLGRRREMTGWLLPG